MNYPDGDVSLNEEDPRLRLGELNVTTNASFGDVAISDASPSEANLVGIVEIEAVVVNEDEDEDDNEKAGTWDELRRPDVSLFLGCLISRSRFLLILVSKT
ncbi:hypothetical protein SAMD00023353_0103030 [Rosellinia necatrix]|uniref:Uncharacterized protein n=1 Tax=Rosellinia necatrix TaxID=77044 RepID=A0A1S8A4T5_ROSNE|nr:hypothetical protein SAMD00023353_0103030 [Rosellinia necatrix]